MVSSVVAGMRYFLVIFLSCVVAFALMLHVLFRHGCARDPCAQSPADSLVRLLYPKPDL